MTALSARFRRLRPFGAALLTSLVASAPAPIPATDAAQPATAESQHDGVADYSIDAVRYATIRGFPLAGLVMGAPRDERIDIAMVVWLIRGEGRTILFDAGFHRARWFDAFDVADYVRPDSALLGAGVRPEDVTDIIVSHAHWDHMGGIDLFPEATVHIQRDEFAYYTADAWQEGGRRGGIDTLDIVALVRRTMQGKVRLVAGDDVEVLPGIRAYTGARHTYASQYIVVDAGEPFVLASDNCYLYRNLDTRTPGATFTPADRAANVAALDRMIALAGDPRRVVPGHDMLVFERYAAEGRVARITP
jgi:glyoxylase-like metal-dependent hydrolase (beta-lactamase superfamily II)